MEREKIYFFFQVLFFFWREVLLYENIFSLYLSTSLCITRRMEEEEEL